MADYSANEVVGIVAGATAALGTLGVSIREYLKREKVGNAADAAQIGGLGANTQIIGAMREELNRLAVRVDVLEKQVDALTDKLANVRLIALDCYQLANECDCEGAHKARLLDHLKQIIKDA